MCYEHLSFMVFSDVSLLAFYIRIHICYVCTSNVFFMHFVESCEFLLESGSINALKST